MTNPLVDPYLILSKIYSEGAMLKQAISDTPIEELNKGRTIKIVYGVLENDAYLSYCIQQYAPKSPKLAVRTILKISLYLLIFMNKQKYMVTDNAVALCKKLGKSGVSGFVNAFLRKFDLQKIKLPQGEEGFCIEHSYPLFAYKKLKQQYGDRADSIVLATTKGVSVRFVKNEEKYDEKEKIDTCFPTLKIFKNFVRDQGFFQGDYTFQSIGSMAICDVVSPCENMLDACAAPGGKSVLLAEKCKNVTSFELHEHRVKLITQYKQRMGIENITEQQKDSSIYDESLKEKFDGVLCDVPCSGFGTVCENPDIKRNKTEQSIADLQKTQKAILCACSQYVKKGGYLYYSTCSLFEQENDGIINEFIKENNQFTVEKIASPLENISTQYGLQFLPDTAYGAGFYICKMKRL